MKEYAVYKGENILAIGTIKEISKQLNVKEDTVRFWRTPANYRRIKKNGKIAIVLDNMEEK